MGEIRGEGRECYRNHQIGKRHKGRPILKEDKDRERKVKIGLTLTRQAESVGHMVVSRIGGRFTRPKLQGRVLRVTTRGEQRVLIKLKD